MKQTHFCQCKLHVFHINHIILRGTITISSEQTVDNQGIKDPDMVNNQLFIQKIIHIFFIICKKDLLLIQKVKKIFFNRLYNK